MKKNWLFTIYHKNKTVLDRIVFKNHSESEALDGAISYIENTGITNEWTVVPFKIIPLQMLGINWYVRITPTTFELLDSNDEKNAETGDLYFACNVGSHNLGDPTEMDDTIFQSKEWAEWYNWKAAPAMEDIKTQCIQSQIYLENTTSIWTITRLAKFCLVYRFGFWLEHLKIFVWDNPKRKIYPQFPQSTL